MIGEHPDVPAARLAATVRHEWGVESREAAHLAGEGPGWHWAVSDDQGPRWFATLDALGTFDERRSRLASFQAARELGDRLPLAVVPVLTRDARVAVDLAPGLLLSLTPYLRGTTEDTGLPVGDDTSRCLLARMLGELHRQSRPRQLPVWQARIPRRDGLERCLDLVDWSGGPWSCSAGHLVLDARQAVRRSLRRFSLLAAAVTGNAERWVPTHGEPHASNLRRTPDGPRLLGWGGLALAPRERDLGEVLGGAGGSDPWFAYVEAGGGLEPLSPGAVELFALERHLLRVADQAVRFSRPHQDTPDERRRFADLEESVGALVAGWS